MTTAPEKKDDVEMKDAGTKAKADEEAEVKKELTPKEKQGELVKALSAAVGTLVKGIAQKEERLVLRALRVFTTLRHDMTAGTYRSALQAMCPNSGEASAWVWSQDVDADVDFDATASTEPKYSVTGGEEVTLFFDLLSLIFLIEHQHFDKAVLLSTALVGRLAQARGIHVHPLSAQAYTFYSLAHEKAGKLGDVREAILAAHRTSYLDQDQIGQAVLTNLLLRNYIQHRLFDQASKLMSKAVFPENASNHQAARYLYYTGKIKAIELDYSEAHARLSQALRKAPQSTARGFRVAVQKLACLVQLLMGDIPERNIFFGTDTAPCLGDYYALTQAVRVGDLVKFAEVTKACSARFVEDQTATLIQRLRTNVIKTGLRKLSTAYSNISLETIRAKLALSSVQEAESVVAKAVRDGVIDAVIDHDAQTVSSKEFVDVYSSEEPLSAFHTRISFCLNVHNDAVKAMRFPDKETKEDPDDALRKRLAAEEAEIAEALAEEEEEM
eukprot:TRINITY_DN33117_c0_g1_i1.p1 TRINITY_DN33117_c0_g1~~TRINITY_DN33117_c0_g1_i1.p1  ORF type:complete len:544 (-),score=147.33 TRINITY_DN33117_c0_g1_i1:218-1714(-)